MTSLEEEAGKEDPIGDPGEGGRPYGGYGLNDRLSKSSSVLAPHDGQAVDEDDHMCGRPETL
jgi:hypothetical protein